jgi:hypothetical protein
VGKNPGKAAPAEAVAARSEEKVATDVVEKRQPEAWWRNRAASFRTQVDQLRERLEPLLVANAMRDASPVLKASNETEIRNLRTGLESLQKQWARLEASATEAKAPADWLEPRPQFPQ